MLGVCARNPANATHFYVDRNVEEGRGERTALIHEEGLLTYRQLQRRVRRAAGMFSDAGIGCGDRVVLLLADGPLMVTVIFGLLRIGAIPVPLSTRLSVADNGLILHDCRPAGLVCEEEIEQLLAPVAAKVDDCRHRWTDVGLAEALAAGPEEDRFAGFDGDQIAIIQYTSGSTGRPKGVLHSHRPLIEVSAGIAARLGLSEEDVGFAAAKLSFGYGFGNSLLLPFRVGAATILYSPLTTVYGALDVIARLRPTVFSGVPSLYAAILKAPHAEEYDLSSLRLCLSAGERLSGSLAERWKRRFGHELLDCFGATECVHIFLSSPPGASRADSAGQVVPGFEVELVDEAQWPVAPGEIGELYVRGVCSGSRYWNRDDATLDRKLGPWVRTGDMFHRDNEGYYYFVGRSDDIIKVGGFKVSPLEVEECFLAHPAVGRCAVVAGQTADGLTTIVAYVCTATDAKGDGSLRLDLKHHARRQLAKHKCPQVIHFVDELPLTTTGKIARHQLRSATIKRARER